MLYIIKLIIKHCINVETISDVNSYVVDSVNCDTVSYLVITRQSIKKCGWNHGWKLSVTLLLLQRAKLIFTGILPPSPHNPCIKALTSLMESMIKQKGEQYCLWLMEDVIMVTTLNPHPREQVVMESKWFHLH